MFYEKYTIIQAFWGYSDEETKKEGKYYEEEGSYKKKDFTKENYEGGERYG